MRLDSESIIIGIILINGIISILYMGVMWIQLKKNYVFFRGTVMLLCPIVGVSCYFFCYIFDLLFPAGSSDYSDLSLDKSKREFLEEIDKEKEMEILPFEEVLAVSTVKDRRKAMLDMLKMDMRENLGRIRKAVENDDTETSHYAASVLTDVFGRFTLELNNLQVKYDNDRSNKENNIEFLDAVMRILNSGGLLGVEKMKYEYMFINLLINLDKYNPGAITESYYAMMVKVLHNVGRSGEAEVWAQRSLDLQPETEQSYLNVMYIKYVLGKEEDFEAAFEKLRKSDVALSQKGLDIVRFWLAR